MSVEIEAQVAQRLIAGLRAAAPVAADDLGRFGVFSVSQHRDDAIEFGHDIERKVAAAWLVGVKRVLVELQMLLGDTAEDHRAQAAGADG